MSWAGLTHQSFMLFELELVSRREAEHHRHHTAGVFHALHDHIQAIRGPVMLSRFSLESHEISADDKCDGLTRRILLNSATYVQVSIARLHADEAIICRCDATSEDVILADELRHETRLWRGVDVSWAA